MATVSAPKMTSSGLVVPPVMAVPPTIAVTSPARATNEMSLTAGSSAPGY